MIYKDCIDRKIKKNAQKRTKKSMPKSLCQMARLWLLTAGVLFLLCGCTQKTAAVEGLELFTSADEGDGRTDAAGGTDEAGEAAALDAALHADLGADRAEETAGQQAGGVSETDSATENVKTADCYVHVCGAVKRPGVYCMKQGERIFEAVTAAGGFLEDACEDYVNQATAVTDGCRIWIPTRKEAGELGWQHPDTQLEIQESGVAGAEQSGETSGLVDINTATKEQLCTLRGIGETKAEAIIAYREAHGAFRNREDIMKVAGIKQSGYDKIKEQITVGRE